MSKCPNCGHERKITRLFRKDGTPRTNIIGRPRKVSRDMIVALREHGRSLGEIAKALNISKGSVEYALRSKRAGDE